MTAGELPSDGLGVGQVPLVGGCCPEVLDLVHTGPVTLHDVSAEGAVAEVVQRHHVGDAVVAGEVTREELGVLDVPGLLTCAP